MRTLLDQYIIDRIREKRIAHKMSQEVFSEKMGFKSNSFVAAAENPRSTKKYNPLHINKAALIFNCKLWDLVPQHPLTDNSIIKPLSKKSTNL
jgi:transcriptional regulator with XRE-family HTH domain